MKKKKTSSRSAAPADAAYLHFKLKSDPFTTLSLRPQNLEHFIGRELLVDRVSSALFSLSNVGLAGEPGVGKSSLMRVVQSKVPSRFYWVAISVPMHDAAYFFSELLREILVAVPKVKGMDLKALSRRLE